MQRKRSRVGLASMDVAGPSSMPSPRRSLSWDVMTGGPWAGAASSAPRSTAPEAFFSLDEAGSFLHPQRGASGPLFCATAVAGGSADDLPGSSEPDADSPGSALDWEPSQQPLAGGSPEPRGAGGWSVDVDADVAEGASPPKRAGGTAWRRFASALAGADGGAADDDYQDEHGGPASGWGAQEDDPRGAADAAPPCAEAPCWGGLLPSVPSFAELAGAASQQQQLLAAPRSAAPAGADASRAAWEDPGAASQRAADADDAFAFGSQPPRGGAYECATQLPFAGDAWQASQQAPCDFFSQRDSCPASQPFGGFAVAAVPSAAAPAGLAGTPFALRAAPPDASRTPPHYTMDTFVPPHGCALEMSPGETGGSQYIASPLLHAYAQGDLPQLPPVGEDSASAGTEQGSQRMPLYPIFMPRGQKVLHLVRHGESEYNAACGAPGSSWDEPLIWDAPLSTLGRAQATALGPALSGLVAPGALWVASPLTRAIQTCLLARNAVRGADAARWPEPSRAEPWLHVRSELAEHLVTSGDVGRPSSVLAQHFATELHADSFAHLAEQWWYCPTGRTNCALRGILQASEPKADLKRRIGAFRNWVISRPEREMVVFGHSTFFKYFTNSDNRLKNCEVITIRV